MSGNTQQLAKPVILTFVNRYLPGYKSGGPLRTVANMVAALGDTLEFRIVTSDRDAGDACAYPDLGSKGAWIPVGKALALYLTPEQKTLRHLAWIIRKTPHDMLYLNSFLDPDFTVKPLLARFFGLAPKTQCIIAPRGEFSPGALELKAWKKNPFIAAARLSGIYRGLTWQASSAREEVEIRQALGGLVRHVCIAIDVPGVVEFAAQLHTPRTESDPLRICFLSRISPKKNLDYALAVMAQLSARACFDVYGPVGDEVYWSKCQALMARLPSHVEARYRGSVEHAKVSSVLASYDLFFLPTRGENYGHVVLESLSAGTPVLLADTTPWRNLADAGVGWELPLNRPDGFVETIERMARMTMVEQADMRSRALAYGEKCSGDPGAIEANRRLFVTRASS